MNTSPHKLQQWNRAKRLRILRQIVRRAADAPLFPIHIPITWLTHPGIFSRQNDPSDTIYHHLACARLFHRIPVRYRVASNLLMSEFRESSVLHLVAYTGQLHLVPSNLLTETNLLSSDSDGNTVFHRDSANKCHLLELFPHLFLSDHVLFLPNDKKRTPLHFIAMGGNLGKLPPELLTRENLLLKDVYGLSVFHFAAANRALHQIPTNLLTAEIILLPDRDEWTVLRYAFSQLDLNCIPVTAELVPHFQLISGVIRDAFFDSKHKASWDSGLAFYPSARRWLAKIVRLSLTGTDFPHNS